MKFLKKVGAALVSLAMLAGTAFTNVAFADDNEGYNVYCAKVDMGSDQAYLLSVQNVPEKWINYVNSSAIIANIRFGNIEQKEWSDNYVSIVVNNQNVNSAIFNSDGADENAMSATLTKTDDNVYGMEAAFAIDSKYMEELSKYNYVAVILVADVSGEGDWQYFTHDIQSEEEHYLLVPISWVDWTAPADTPEPTEEPSEPTVEPTEPTEEPIVSTEPDETAEPIISEEPVEEPAETETTEVVTPDEPETEAPETPAEPAPAESATTANTAANKGNPDTGAAIAVIPLLIAGAGTAVLTRKRK